MEYLLKASAVICIFYICFQLLLKRETFFNHNRWFLIIGLVLALVFPLVIIPVYIPVETTVTTETTFQVSKLAVNNTNNDLTDTFEWSSLLPIIYCIGLSVLFLHFLIQFGSLVWLLLKNPKNKEGIYTYVIVNHKISPFSFFKWIVFNPKDFTKNELELILMHEKVHVNQMHSLDILFSKLACVIFWFNPLIWLYKKEVRQNLEYIADYKTQSISKDDKAYQHLLLKTSINNTNISLPNNFYNSQIKKRIIMLHKSKSHSKKQWKYLLVLPILAGLLMSMNTEKVYVDNSSKISKHLYTDPIKIIFNKSITDDELDKISNQLKEHGVLMQIQKIKRNENDEIIAINIDFEGNGNKANYGVSGNKAIKPFYFEMTNDNFGVGNHIYEEIIIAEEVKIYNSPQNSKTKSEFIINENEKIEDSGNEKTTKKDINKEIIRKESKRYYDGDKPIILKNDKQTEIIYPNENKIIYRDIDNPKPLIIVDGKEIDYDKIEDVEPNSIREVNVIKNENAIEAYGDKGEHGAIIITTNNNSTSSNVSKTKTKTKTESPWVISYNSTYVDVENPSKNGSLVYITKKSKDFVLEHQKAILEKLDITVKYSKLRRNKNGDITSLKITLKSKDGKQTSSTYKNDEGIANIEYGISDGKLVVRTSLLSLD